MLGPAAAEVSVEPWGGSFPGVPCLPWRRKEGRGALSSVRAEKEWGGLSLQQVAGRAAGSGREPGPSTCVRAAGGGAGVDLCVLGAELAGAALGHSSVTC